MLLDALTLSTTHRQDLQRRGLRDQQIDAGGYRTWPQDRYAQVSAAMAVFHGIGNETFTRIPGLGPGCTEIHAAPGLLIPVRDLQARIIALVVRLDDPGDSGKYRWLSSRTKRNPNGPSPGSPGHVPIGVCGPVDTIRITEGQLKADVATRLSGIPTLGFPGVESWRRVLPVLAALQVEAVRVAFDGDAGTNRNVARCLLDCVTELQAQGYVAEVERWPADGGKGVDDILAAGREADIEILAGPAAVAAAEAIATAAGVDVQPAAPAAASEEKKSQSTLLVELAQAAELWHAPGDGDAYASVRFASDGGDDDDSDAGDKPGDGGPVAHWPIRGRAFRRWLAREFFLSYGKAPGSQALADATNVIEGQAAFAGQERPVFVRVAGHDGRLYLDLGNTSWQAVEIGADGWRVIESEACPVRFRRAKAMMPLPTPATGGDIAELRQFVNVTPDDWPLLLGWLVAAVRPIGPYPVLALHGEQGSAKSTTARTLRAIIDPNAAPVRCEPREPRDLMIAATNGWVIALDNLSYLPGWLSDALCRLSTGGGFATRQLYSDDEETIFDAMRPVILTGIEDVANRSDLLDRSLILQLPRIPEDRRIPEAVFWREFHAAAPGILGAILDAVSTAVRSLPTTHIERLPRMADFALFGVLSASVHESFSGGRYGWLSKG